MENETEEQTRFNSPVNRAKYIRLRAHLSTKRVTIADWIDECIDRELKKAGETA